MTEFNSPFNRHYENLESFPKELLEELLCYTGSSSRNTWTDVEKGKCISYLCTFWVDEPSTIDNFSTFCPIVADGEALKNLLICKRTGVRRRYCQLDFTTVLSFGLTELAAHIRYNVDVSFW